jgi:hypothetical protein
MKKKNADYSENGPFQNFRFCEGIGVSAEKGILVRLGDKISRLSTLLSRPAQVTDESFEDTICDILNYTVILAGLRRENTRKERE